MSYAAGRVIHDADAHLMELPDCLDDFLSSEERALLHETGRYRNAGSTPEWAQKARAKQADRAFRAEAAENIMLRKGYQAMGAFMPEDRPAALDLLGFASQLTFTTFCLGNFGLDHREDPTLAYIAAGAHNRMITDFCARDKRMLPVGYVPIADFDAALRAAKDAIALGCKALMIPSRCPRGHSPSHVGLDPLWALASEARLPIVFHVGGGDVMNPDYAKNGLPPVPDFTGGDGNFTSVSFMPIPNAVMQTLAVMIFDGVLDRFPMLKFGAIELGASWLPSWMRAMDAAAHAFLKNEERLKKLSARPSEIVRRQVRVTPYVHEDAGWIIANSASEICMFSSDFPHTEGGRNPLKRFDESLANTPAHARDRFYCDNFVDLMGEGLARELRTPKNVAA